MIALLWTMPTVRWRAAYQALMFCAFNLFWTAVPLYLADRFGLGERGIGLFALAGCGGAVAAPLAGRLADAGHTRRTTAGAMLVLGLSFLVSCWSGTGAAALAMLTVLAILIDAAVQANQVVGQRVIFSVASEHRGRVNAIYMTCLFIGAAIGSVLGTATYHRGGWPATGATGAGIGLLLLVLFALDRQRPGAAGADPADA
jgi:predicted MFS family arabinose efflux permease